MSVELPSTPMDYFEYGARCFKPQLWMRRAFEITAALIVLASTVDHIASQSFKALHEYINTYH